MLVQDANKQHSDLSDVFSDASWLAMLAVDVCPCVVHFAARSRVRLMRL